MMKKKMKQMAALVLAVAFMAAGAMSAAAESEKPEAYRFTYQEKQYQPGMEAKTAMDTLGKADSSRDVNNCANGYVNKAYMYGDKAFELYVEQEGKKEIVANITLLTEKVATEEGLKVGDSGDRVQEVYKDAVKGLGSYTAVLGETKLYIKLKDNKVSYITYMRDPVK